MILTPCLAYAGTATGSAISIDDHLQIMAAGGVDPIEVASVKAAAASPTGTVTDPIYVNFPVPNSTEYFFLDTDTGELDSVLHSDRSIFDVFENLTYMMANNLQWLYHHGTDNGYAGLIYMERALRQLEVDSMQYASQLANLSTISSRINTSNTRLNSIITNLSSIITSLGTTNSTLDSINTTTTTDSNRWNWSSTFNTTFTLRRYAQNGEGGTASDLSVNPTNRSMPNQIWYWLAMLNNSTVAASRDLLSGVGTANTQTYLDKDLNPISMGRTSFWRDFRNIGGNINDIVARLGFVLANDDDIAARQASATNTSAVVDDFIKPTGSAHASVSDFGSVADLAAAGSDNLSSGVAPSVLLDQLGGDGDGWGWFSQQIQDELTAPSGRSDLRSNSKSGGSDTPYLDAYYADLEEKIGFKLW